MYCSETLLFLQRQCADGLVDVGLQIILGKEVLLALGIDHHSDVHRAVMCGVDVGVDGLLKPIGRFLGIAFCSIRRIGFRGFRRSRRGLGM